MAPEQDAKDLAALVAWLTARPDPVQLDTLPRQELEQHLRVVCETRAAVARLNESVLRDRRTIAVRLREAPHRLTLVKLSTIMGVSDSSLARQLALGWKPARAPKQVTTPRRRTAP